MASQIKRLSSSERIFSLTEWTLLSGAYVRYNPSTGAVTTSGDPSRLSAQDRFELFHLTDYVVSSVTAGTVWLVQRTQEG